MKFKLIFEDNTSFQGNSFEADWNKAPEKIIKAMQFICTNPVFVKQLNGKTTLTFVGYKQYNHLVEHEGGFGTKPYSSKIFLMARQEENTFIVTFDLKNKTIFKKQVPHGMEYGKQILAGWKDGILAKDPKIILN